MRPGRAAAWLLLAAAACQAAPAPATRVRVTLAGSEHGQFEGTAATSACVRAPAGPGSLGVQFTDWTGPKDGLRSLSLVVPAVSRPGDFYLGMVFGDFFAGHVLEIETRAGAPAARGHGAVRVAPGGGTTTVTVTGTTDEAVTLTATITCVNPAAEGAGR